MGERRRLWRVMDGDVVVGRAYSELIVECHVMMHVERTGRTCRIVEPSGAVREFGPQDMLPEEITTIII